MSGSRDSFLEAHGVAGRSVGTLWLDPEGHVIAFDEELVGVLGLVERDWRDRALWEVFPFDDQAGAPTEASELASAASRRVELSCVLESDRHVLLTLRGLPPGGGPTPGRGEPAYVGALVCVDHVSQVFRSAAEIELRTTIGSIISGFAHEVRNPLAAIVSLTESVLYPETPAEISEALVRVPPLIERIESLIQEALTYGRPRRPRAQWHQLAHLMRRAFGMLDQAGVHLEPAMLDEVPANLPIYVDLDHCLSTVTNVLENAAQAAGVKRVALRIRTEEVGRRISIYCRVPQVLIDVVDAGPGIPADVGERIWQPFFTTKRGGTGLGLALARDLARMNGGDLMLVETSSGGTTFRIAVPMVAERATSA